jgi:hypothetical protein
MDKMHSIFIHKDFFRMKLIILLILAIVCICRKSDASPQSWHIQWDEKTLTLIQKDGNYARMIRMHNGDILCCFEYKSKIGIKLSRDDGKHFNDMSIAASCSFGACCNPEIVELRNGTILCFYNQRPSDGIHPYAICMSSSSDGGATWSDARSIYEAGRSFSNGCWEPAPLLLPSGKLLLFFANEFPYPNSSEQEISMIQSTDNGGSWSNYSTVSFRKGHRDGMPVPILLKHKGIFLIIEDNGLEGAFKPVIVQLSTTPETPIHEVKGDSHLRWGAIIPPLPASVYAGAPYIVQMPNGMTAISVQSDQNHDKPRMIVYTGDENAQNFQHGSIPFTLAQNQAGMWNSLFVKGNNTSTAISSTVQNGIFGIWSIDGRILHSE